MFLTYYFHDDFSLGEIATEFHISRQAVYEHIKRAQSILETYEFKLGLLKKYEQRSCVIQKIRRTIETSSMAAEDQTRLFELMDELE